MHRNRLGVFLFCCLWASQAMAQTPAQPTADKAKEATKAASSKAKSTAASAVKTADSAKKVLATKAGQAGDTAKQKTQKAKQQAQAAASKLDNLTGLDSRQRALELMKQRKAYTIYNKASLDYLRELQALVQKQYRERRRLIAGGYEAQIDQKEKKNRKLRLLAIERFIKFINKYPSNPKNTPDAMYRLAELYYEKEFLTYLDRSKEYEKDLTRFENKELQNEPIQPKKQFPQTIYWLTSLTNRFPVYRYVPTAYYLLGYCKSEEGNNNEAIKYYRAITQRYTPDKFPDQKVVYVEAWVRMGEYYFRENKNKKAKAAFREVLKYPNHPMYDKALYKLAWAHYLTDEFDTSVNLFTNLLEFYIKRKDKKGGELRKEAIQYIANSFVDEKWGSPGKAVEYLKKIGIKKNYSRDILLQISSNYKNQQLWAKLIDVNRELLRLYPLHPENPQIHIDIVRAYTSMGRLDLALQERARLVRMYGEGGPWDRANEKNPQARKLVQKIVSKNIKNSAYYRHGLCNLRRKEAGEAKTESQKRDLLKKALAQCRLAASSYRSFLKRNKHDKDAYELTWYLADSLYFSGNFLEAATNFKKVRDWPGSKKYFQEAAFSLIDAIAQQVNDKCRRREIKRGCELPGQRNSRKKKKKKKKNSSSRSVRRKKIPKLPIPQLQQDLLAAREFFTKNVKDPKDKRITGQLLLMSRIYYSYDHLETARKYYWNLLKRHKACKQAPLIKSFKQIAGDTIVASYRREGRLDDYVLAIDDLKPYCVFIKGENDIKTGVQYIKANRLKAEGKYEKAAYAFLKIVNKDPRHKDAPAGLWNAATMFKQANRPGTALQIYERIVRDYPRWKLADIALFEVAGNAEKYFNFRKALASYMKLANESAFRRSKKRADAVYNAALLLNNLQRYGEAAKMYQRYANDFRSRDDSLEMLYNSAMVYKKANRPGEMVQVLRSFINRASGKKKQIKRVMTAYGLIMLQQEKQGLPWRQMQREYEKVIRVYDQLKPKMQPTDIRLTRRYPGRASYKLAMKTYGTFLDYKIDSKNQRKQVKQIQEKSKLYNTAATEFNKITRFQSPPWLLCALYRIAEGKQKIAEGIKKAPLPKIKGIKWTEETIEIYKEQIDQKFIMPLEDQAKKLYETAVKSSQKLHYENKCTRKAYEELNKIDPSVPLPKKLKHQHKDQDNSPLPLLTKLSTPKKAAKKPTKKASAKSTKAPVKPESTAPTKRP